MFENKMMKIFNNISEELAEIRKIAIEELADKLIAKSKIMANYYKNNHNKHELIMRKYGDYESDLVILDYIKDCLDDYYSKNIDEYRNDDNINWIGKFKLPKLQNKKLSNIRYRELMEEYIDLEKKAYDPYSDDDKISNIFENLCTLNYLGYKYEFYDNCGYYFIDEDKYILYEIVVEKSDKGNILRAVYLHGNIFDYLIDE